jgi:hypothetical protein
MEGEAAFDKQAGGGRDKMRRLVAYGQREGEESDDAGGLEAGGGRSSGKRRGPQQVRRQVKHTYSNSQTQIMPIRNPAFVCNACKKMNERSTPCLFKNRGLESKCSSGVKPRH